MAVAPPDSRPDVSLVSGLQLNPTEAAERIAATLRRQVGDVLRRRGLVVAMSGGIDSSVCAGLAVRAVGPEHVFGLMLPERESDAQSLDLASQWAGMLGIALVAARCISGMIITAAQNQP